MCSFKNDFNTKIDIVLYNRRIRSRSFSSFFHTLARIATCKPICRNEDGRNLIAFGKIGAFLFLICFSLNIIASIHNVNQAREVVYLREYVEKENLKKKNNSVIVTETENKENKKDL